MILDPRSEVMTSPQYLITSEGHILVIQNIKLFDSMQMNLRI